MVARREPDNREHAQVLVAQHRLEPARQRLIGQQRVEIHGNLGDTDAMALGRDASMQVGQGLAVIEPPALRHEPFDQLQHAVGPVDKAAQHFVGVGSLPALPSLIEEALGARRILRRRQIQEGEEIG